MKRWIVPMAAAICLVLVLGLFACAEIAAAGDAVPRMQPADLLARLDLPDILVIDVRRGRDWDDSDVMIRNAVRRDYRDVQSWINDLPKGKTIVLYCA